MTKKLTKINNFFIISLVSVLLLTLGITQIQSKNIFNSLDEVIKTKASTGNISPSLFCGGDIGYYQDATVATLSNINLSTPLDTELTFNNAMFESALNPIPSASRYLNSLCVQAAPNFGGLYEDNNIFLPGVSNSTNFDQYFYSQYLGKYVPPTGFKGVACFDFYTRTIFNSAQGFVNPLLFGAISASAQTVTYLTPHDSNVAQVKIQVGGSTSTTCGADPVTGQVGSPFPSFYTAGLGTVFEGSTGIFIPAGSSTSIRGRFINNYFVPDLGQIIPLDSTIGLQNAVFTAGSDGLYPVQTNFSPAPVQVSNGGTITIKTVTQSLSSLSSSLTVSSSQSSFLSSNLSKVLELSFDKYNKPTSNGNNLDITDPYDCGLQIITGSVKYNGNTSDLNPVEIKLTNTKDNAKIYSFSPSLDDKGGYQINVKNIPLGNYKVDFSISDKLNNKASGAYDFVKKDICEDSINKSTTYKEQNSRNLARTGGVQSGFVYSLAILVLIMFVVSQFISCENKE